ncbi:hypothetical protein ACFLY3_01760 [Chloroflexota bacterium]
MQIQLEAYKGQSKWWSSVEDQLFPRLLQHSPSVNTAYEFLLSLHSPEMVWGNREISERLTTELQESLDPLLDPIDPTYDTRYHLYTKMSDALEDESIPSSQRALETLSHAGLFTGEVIKYRQAIEETFSHIFNNSESRRRIIEDKMHRLQASIELKKAVDTCLLSNEYTKHKCDWCT